jgi:hypothetical protein
MTVNDPDNMLVDFVRPAGIKTVYVSRNYTGDYNYSTQFELSTKEAISAVEVRFLVFDIWGQHRRTLVGTEVLDLAAKATKSFNFDWNLFSESEAAQHYASIAYVSRVRTQDGRILSANTKFVLDQARKFSAKFSETDLEPTKDKK